LTVALECALPAYAEGTANVVPRSSDPALAINGHFDRSFKFVTHVDQPGQLMFIRIGDAFACGPYHSRQHAQPFACLDSFHAVSCKRFVDI